MLMAKKKIDIEKIVTHLIGLGKKRGFITFDEMNEAVPSLVSTEQIDTIMDKISAAGISMTDTEDDAEEDFNEKLEESIQVIKNPLSREQRLFLVDLAKLPSKESKLTRKERINLYKAGNLKHWSYQFVTDFSRMLYYLRTGEELDNELQSGTESLSNYLDELEDEHAQELFRDIGALTNYYLSEIRANLGDPDAQENCGDYWRFGLHAEVDLKKAFKLYKKAATQGLASAQYKIGLAYIDDELGYEDLDEARRWLMLAAEQGDEDARKLLKEIESINSGANKVIDLDQYRQKKTDTR